MLAFAALGAALLIGGLVSLAGSVLVIDRTEEVRSAAIMSGDGELQPLRQIWRGIFFAVPRLEGAIELRCHSGARTRSGYVTRHLTTRLLVIGDTPCRTVIQ